MLKEKLYLVAPTMPPDCKKLTPKERRRLTHLNFWTGNGSATYFKPLSPAAHLRRKRVVDRIIKDILAKEAKEGRRKERGC
jgi:hypothetical protein